VQDQFAGEFSSSSSSPLLELLKSHKVERTGKLANPQENHYAYSKVERFWAFLSGLPTLAANVNFLLHPTKSSVSKQQH
jgi:hypothetical protein